MQSLQKTFSWCAMFTIPRGPNLHTTTIQMNSGLVDYSDSDSSSSQGCNEGPRFVYSKRECLFVELWYLHCPMVP